MRNPLFSLALLGGLAFSSTALADDTTDLMPGDALAQDDDSEGDDSSGDDDLDDILDGTDTSEETVGEEQDALRRGDIDDRAGVDGENLLEGEDAAGPKRTIKTVQRKDFMKLGRFEAGPSVGFVTNDPFLNRYIAGVRLGYHVTEIFGLEGELSYSPDLGEADWKPLTSQLVNENHVSPDISKLTLIGNLTFQFSPIYGKVALNGNNIIHFDVYGAFGMGFTRTVDDLKALQAEGDQVAEATQFQMQPTTNFGGGARVVFNQTIAVRVDARSLVYIETVNSTTLEMKNNFILSGGVHFFFPQMQS